MRNVRVVLNGTHQDKADFLVLAPAVPDLSHVHSRQSNVSVAVEVQLRFHLRACHLRLVQQICVCIRRVPGSNSR